MSDWIDTMLDAIDKAEAEAKALHDAGRCHESEWSCSWCEEGGERQRGPRHSEE